MKRLGKMEEFPVGGVKLDHVLGTDVYIVLEDFFYRDEDYDIVVLAGTLTDGASIPRFFFRLIGHPYEEYIEAAVVHDDGYVKGGLYDSFGNFHELTKKEVDDIFLRVMERIGVKKWRRKMMYRAVRWFGRGIWGRR